MLRRQGKDITRSGKRLERYRACSWKENSTDSSATKTMKRDIYINQLCFFDFVLMCFWCRVVLVSLTKDCLAVLW